MGNNLMTFPADKKLAETIVKDIEDFLTKDISPQYAFVMSYSLLVKIQHELVSFYKIDLDNE
jgi:hypothetical protein